MNGDRPTITLLGGSISTNDEFEELSTEQWDIVFDGFKDVVPWYLFPCLYMSFADHLHMSKLLLQNRYGEDWLPEEKSLRDCTDGAFLGFVVSTQALCDPPLPEIAAEAHCFRGTEFRNYVAGRMSTNDPLAEALFDELKRRTRSCLLVVWKGSGFENPLFQTEGDMFIKRTRTAKTRDDLSNVPWEISWDLSHIESDLRKQRSIYRETYEDYLQFLVIDRVAGLPFTMIIMIEDALMELNRDSSLENGVRKAVMDIAPEAEKETYPEAMVAAMTLDASRPELNVKEVSYEGNRSRCWDADQILLELLETRRGTTVSIEHARFISALCIDMESKGIIKIMDAYVAPQGMACAFPGSDGKLDLYIDYRPVLATAQPSALGRKFDLPPADSLLCVAEAFDRRNPTAIFIKASVVTNYCALPMDAMGPSSIGLPNFTTLSGHIY